jgi:hypothetical protein
MLDSLTHRPAQISGKEKMFLLGDLTLILSIREEIHQRLQAADPADALCQQPIADTEPQFVPAFLFSTSDAVVLLHRLFEGAAVLDP